MNKCKPSFISVQALQCSRRRYWLFLSILSYSPFAPHPLQLFDLLTPCLSVSSLPPHAPRLFATTNMNIHLLTCTYARGYPPLSSAHTHTVAVAVRPSRSATYKPPTTHMQIQVKNRTLRSPKMSYSRRFQLPLTERIGTRKYAHRTCNTH
ncbi:hypothetical protein Tb927.3.5770 [Trypanosoma brucei brucei TREU927]|uniref:Uncharacterized protein n=1 Tax=Trypanosoma brucei brucei (strain 927/4 GUTat10.1) TaxID=185431 RepID=Q57VG7_TRYB2|nr:hypothetical protein Tb927.3.5770 [Trypanosoma brucei brucei TREU927]AAX70402.1 hypothetical protein Tb927.3.5770 [Trypanosoma brucei]AAZ10607.1 hypothetical protein Tb927.3.5770 [Trypanosoma brucei brucei TREU927]